MAAIDKAVKINGRKRRSWKQKDGKWTDPFAEHDIWSRTFLPPATETIEADTDMDMVIELKKPINADVTFDPKALSTESLVKLIDAKLEAKIDEKPIIDIDVKPVIKSVRTK